MDFDVFISHASEDKKDFVEPLANALVKGGLNVWYDRFELTIGDSLREKIDQGLANSRYGIVVLSSSFFAKEWPKTELDALVTRQNSEREKVILPIWHNVTAEDVKKFSPILASKMAARSADGIDAVVAQIVNVCNNTETSPASIFQTSGTYGLREQCLEIIRNDDILAWRRLVSKVCEPIPDQLKEWKKEYEPAGRQGEEAWRNAVHNAVEICLPGFVPIYAAIEAGKIDYWRNSVGILRRLYVLEEEMGGGLKMALEIGLDMLPIASYLGLSIAASLKLFEFINEWMYLKLPGWTQGVRSEISWVNIFAINRPPGGIDPKEPFTYLKSLANSDLLKNFFDDDQRMVRNIMLGNLLASLIELRDTVQRPQLRKAMETGDRNLHAVVTPVWCIMDRAQFQTSTLELFGDSQSVYNFVFPNHDVDMPEFWALWKLWRKVCVRYWNQGLRYGPLIEFMSLPGEPPR